MCMRVNSVVMSFFDLRLRCFCVWSALVGVVWWRQRLFVVAIVVLYWRRFRYLESGSRSAPLFTRPRPWVLSRRYTFVRLGPLCSFVDG